MTERPAESGFTLLETICVLAVIAMLAAIVLPAIPHATSRTALEAYALKTAALLKSDRNAAVRNGSTVQTELSQLSGTIRSGASGRVVQLPADVTFNASSPINVGAMPAGRQSSFFRRACPAAARFSCRGPAPASKSASLG
jgi:general secretion pathway protein H